MDTSIDGAKGVLINISGGSNLGLLEANEAANLIRESVDPEAEIIFGTTINDDLGDNVIVTVIATGFENKLSKSVKVPITDNINIPFKEEEKPSSTIGNNPDDSTFIDIPVFLQRRRK